jgi:hypothetical protein
MLAVLWVVMMLAWMAGLVLGCWWVWPHVRQLTLTPDRVFSLMWLSTGATAWLVALHLGYRRFWRP